MLSKAGNIGIQFRMQKDADAYEDVNMFLTSFESIQTHKLNISDEVYECKVIV
jgi:hypothetical protein